MGGASPTAALQSAMMAIAAGAAKHVLIVLGWNGYSALRQKLGSPRERELRMDALFRAIDGFYRPFGVISPAQLYAWLAMRHRKLYGVLPEATGWIALACRRHAQLNERAATFGKPIDMETYLGSRMISEPFRLQLAPWRYAQT